MQPGGDYSGAAKDSVYIEDSGSEGHLSSASAFKANKLLPSIPEKGGKDPTVAYIRDLSKPRGLSSKSNLHKLEVQLANSRSPAPSTAKIMDPGTSQERLMALVK